MITSRLQFATALATIGSCVLFAGACSSSSKSGATAPTTLAAASTSTSAPAGPPNLTITAGDYEFAGVPATIPAGIEHITFINKGSVAHEMAFLQVTSNADTPAILSGVEKIFQGAPYPATFLAINGVHDTQPGRTTVT
ncbi:MAG TPA: hypothetical protein VK771_01725, partial [Acidimicrobiia bacterium]|nr:hypothetical protein [Acidimicrobiia bacterium]